MFKYCSESNCGGKTEYSTTPPKFCSKCGQPFDKAFKKAAEAKIQPVIQQVIRKPAPTQIVYVEEEEVVDLPQPSLNDVVIARASKVTIGDLSQIASPLKEASPVNHLPADIEVKSKTPFIIQDLE